MGNFFFSVVVALMSYIGAHVPDFNGRIYLYYPRRRNCSTNRFGWHVFVFLFPQARWRHGQCCCTCVQGSPHLGKGRGPVTRGWDIGVQVVFRVRGVRWCSGGAEARGGSLLAAPFVLYSCVRSVRTILRSVLFLIYF